jgi:sterol desaturase/sphingolipid hydroxylase (fatty acid hydroxylase superfamily)
MRGDSVTLDELLLRHAADVSLWSIVAVLAVAGIWETAAPARPAVANAARRWVASAGLWGIDLVLLKLLAPVSLAGFTLFLAQREVGLLRWLAPPDAVAIALTILALDLRAWLYHRALHASPLLWRVHRVHHSDVEIDLSTGLRFHPLEAIGVWASKLAVIALLGPPVAGVLLHELCYGLVSLFEHANVRLPARLERGVRRVFVTPELHRVHHSLRVEESNANFATMFSFWDRLFGTLREARDPEAMQFGDPELRDPAVQTLPWLLWQPFRGRQAGAAPVAQALSDAPGVIR